MCLVPVCNNLAELWKNGNPRNYCSKHGYSDMQKFTNWRIFCGMVLDRDGRKCVKCGDNRETVEVVVNKKCYGFHPGESRVAKERVEKIKERVSNLEVDHIKELAAGGDMWDINNCQTLCYNCHKRKTAYFNSHKKSVGLIHSGKQKTLGCPFWGAKKSCRR